MVSTKDFKEKKEKKPDPRYATKKDLEKVLKAIGDVSQAVSKITAESLKPKVIEKTVQEIPGTADLSKVKESTTPETPDVVKPTEEEIAGGVEKIPVPPQWRKMVDELLGMDFGIDVVYPQSGSGFLFKIIVPEEKSNMTKDYKEFYKVDVRTKAINYNEGIDGVRKFCEGIKKNLERKQ